MKIDWFTFSAQIINFAVLVYLLGRYLYRPVFAIMEERKNRTENELAAAADKNRQAEEYLASINQRLSEMEKNRTEKIDAARREADDFKKDLLAGYQQETEQARRNWLESLENEKKSFVENISETIVSKNHDLLKKMLQDLADADLEDHIIKYFISTRLPEAVKNINNGDTVFIHSAYEIKPERIEEMESRFASEGLDDLKIIFEKKSNIAAGIEIVCRGQKVSWNLTDYLDKFQKELYRIFSA